MIGLDCSNSPGFYADYKRAKRGSIMNAVIARHTRLVFETRGFVHEVKVLVLETQASELREWFLQLPDGVAAFDSGDFRWMMDPNYGSTPYDQWLRRGNDERGRLLHVRFSDPKYATLFKLTFA